MFIETLELYYVFNLAKNKIMGTIPASILLPPHLYTMRGHMEEDLLLNKLLSFIAQDASTPEVQKNYKTEKVIKTC